MLYKTRALEEDCPKMKVSSILKIQHQLIVAWFEITFPLENLDGEEMYIPIEWQECIELNMNSCSNCCAPAQWGGLSLIQLKLCCFSLQSQQMLAVDCSDKNCITSLGSDEIRALYFAWLQDPLEYEATVLKRKEAARALRQLLKYSNDSRNFQMWVYASVLSTAAVDEINTTIRELMNRYDPDVHEIFSNNPVILDNGNVYNANFQLLREMYQLYRQQK
jgi:hypothetical protein